MESNKTMDALAYLDRWRLVRERQVVVDQTDSLSIRGRQLGTLMASGLLFGKDPRREREADEVRMRWMYIRRTLGD